MGRESENIIAETQRAQRRTISDKKDERDKKDKRDEKEQKEIREWDSTKPKLQTTVVLAARARFIGGRAGRGFVPEWSPVPRLLFRSC